jgi:hypothetical protein
VFRALTSYPEPTVGKGPVGPHCKWTRLPAAPIRGILCLLLAAHSVAAQASVSLEYRSKASFHRELLRDLLSIFKEHFPRHLQALREAVEHRDTKQARVVSHTLKGMLANLRSRGPPRPQPIWSNWRAVERKPRLERPSLHSNAK